MYFDKLVIRLKENDYSTKLKFLKDENNLNFGKLITQTTLQENVAKNGNCYELCDIMSLMYKTTRVSVALLDVGDNVSELGEEQEIEVTVLSKFNEKLFTVNLTVNIDSNFIFNGRLIMEVCKKENEIEDEVKLVFHNSTVSID